MMESSFPWAVEVGLYHRVPGCRGPLQAIVLGRAFSDGIIHRKFVVGSWWSELGLVLKAHCSALWQNYLMAGKSWTATLWLRFSVISSFCCWNWHWGVWGDSDWNSALTVPYLCLFKYYFGDIFWNDSWRISISVRYCP